MKLGGIDLSEVEALDRETYLRALAAVRRRRVVRFTFTPSGVVLWGVYSRKREKLYLVVPGLYCSCAGFAMNVVATGRSSYCYHMVAQKLAEERGEYEDEVLGDEEYFEFLDRIRRTVVLSG